VKFAAKRKSNSSFCKSLAWSGVRLPLGKFSPQYDVTMALAAYFGDIEPVAYHIAPNLIEEDMADSQIPVVAVPNILADMAD
jgi:hypothetical protein